ncbi:B-cell receptor CD22-like [Archocentrus centrarchus]|uniref:B-cell receptor CD22-like n=1 Tax=Archocentrus centrarchus TaxID=63155 RepID=UPI0011EA3424|nr:B-cell receptor CD22-like [Archocentrus centrarchus]
MSGAAMSLITAISGFLLLLTVTAVQGQNGWGVTYTSTQICAIKGSTVETHCTYMYPSRGYTVKKKFWFTKESNDDYVDLRTDPEYSGRVQYQCKNTDCSLRITDLRESDSAQYKFRFTINHLSGKYYGSPGVSLTVTDPQLQVHVRRSTGNSYSNWTELTCHSNCQRPDQSSYIWYKNGDKLSAGKQYFYLDTFDSTDRISCAVKGHEGFCSPAVLVQGQNGWRVTYTSTQICAVKGSTVEIRCSYTYPYSTHYQVQQKLWFTKGTNKEPVDLKSDSDYKGRVEYRCSGQSCTVRITDLRESDSAEYKFRFITNQPDGGYTGSPGVTLTVTALQVQVITAQHLQGYTQVQLRCHSSCLPDHPSYVWIRNGRNTLSQTSSSIQSSFDPADFISCALKGHESFPSPSVSAPRYVSVWVHPSKEIREGSSVTLTCSSDANPAAKLSWYKKDGQTPLSNEQQLSFNSIRSSDSGEFYCTAENKLGRRTSESISVDVTYAPKAVTVSVSPTGEIKEGSSVTLTCSSDANPAAKYTWYKKDDHKPLRENSQLSFSSIQSSDSGQYYCEAVNKVGRGTSQSNLIDVKYAPKLPSVSVSPSAEIVEGSSVTLTCSSDANPAANYTWYKEDEDSPKASGQNFTITDFRPEHSGSYYCVAQNSKGYQNSTLELTIVGGVGRLAAAGVTAAVLLPVIVFSVFLWIRKKRKSKESAESEDRTNHREQRQLQEQDDLQYASIHFNNQADPLYSNMRAAQPRRHTEEQEVAEYTAVRFNRGSEAKRGRSHETEESSCGLYATVNKT